MSEHLVPWLGGLILVGGMVLALWVFTRLVQAMDDWENHRRSKGGDG